MCYISAKCLCKNLTSVPMALGKHLFSFRTQKLSSVAAIILRKWETSTVPNYKRDFRIGSPFSFLKKSVSTVKLARIHSHRTKHILLRY